MNDERFEQLMRDAAATFRRPPEPPLDEMWQNIEVEAFGRRRPGRHLMVAGQRVVRSQWMRIAAALAIGVGLGRGWTATVGERDQATLAAGATAAAPAGEDASSQPYEVATTRYLGQTAALLIALPSEMRAGRADQHFTSRAGDLLLTTRLLLDSPASTDPGLRNLLEDLELVLAQIVRLQDEPRGRTEMELINQALEQRDVLPRLRSAVADIAADD